MEASSDASSATILPLGFWLADSAVPPADTITLSKAAAVPGAAGPQGNWPVLESTSAVDVQSSPRPRYHTSAEVHSGDPQSR